MVGRDLSADLRLEDAMSYMDAVRDALQDAEPEKYEEFLTTFLDFGADRIGIAAFSESIQELLKDHVNLLLGFNVFLPLQFQINIPPEASTEFHKVVGRSVPPKPTMDDATSYLIAVKKAFHDEPAKYEEIIKLLNDLKARRVDAASVIARVEELMKDHLNLLLGFCVFLSTKMSFITKLKARFRGDGSHVVDSVLQIMRMYSEGNKSKNDVYQEVGALIQGHGDLLMELSEIFSDS
ncbi:Paired amphipathic helix superfamily [Arabidopsis thaliana x Arabidopsis arenosa]|uniref:Paired amphipathic helix superfamily n=1 Tax=Arabidopsis thaliana x Arabidopsis arenosa TaxID=1240361 RepID=A0A8T2BZH8_9BRAS|nr:Paired amphipathic helix superfamily [Arabidopsis thaliana x Arabidopsis arenosa]